MKLLLLILFFNILGFSQQKISYDKILNRLKSNAINKNVIIEGRIIIKKKINGISKEKIREFKIYNKFFDSGKYDFKNLLLFISPINIKNTSILTWYSSVHHDSSKRFIYIPALKKTQEINFNNKSFHGFNFDYFEFIREFRNNLLDKNVNIVNKDNYLTLNMLSSNKNFQNKINSQSVWIDKETFNIKRIEFFNIKKKLVIEIIFLKFEKLENKSFPTEFEIVNHEKKDIIFFEISDIKAHTFLNDTIFNEDFSFLKN